MKTIFLFRHAKSDWNNPNLSDFERPLNKRGINDLPLMTDRLLKKNTPIEHLFSSSAARTMATSKGYASGLKLKSSQVSYHKQLYHASVRDLLHFVNEVNDHLSCIGLVGHNPGLTDFCDYLCDDAVYMPTCSFIKIELDINGWKEVSASLGRLIYFEYPKKYV